MSATAAKLPPASPSEKPGHLRSALTNLASFLYPFMEWQALNTSFVVYSRTGEATHRHRDFSRVDPDVAVMLSIA